jgi:hypothetical protein
MPIIPLIFKQQTVVVVRNIRNLVLSFLKQKNENYYTAFLTKYDYEGDKPGWQAWKKAL